jgi:hypothetical protein
VASTFLWVVTWIMLSFCEVVEIELVDLENLGEWVRVRSDLGWER